MPSQFRTICAIATAPGAAGIAVVRLSGPESFSVAAKVFAPIRKEKKVEEARGYTAMYGHFLHRGEPFDDGVALFYRAPHSYTGEDVVELSCHGGSAVAQELVDAAIEAGAAPAGPGEYTRRALMNGKMSLTQAEAVMGVISADSRRGAALAHAQLEGALAGEIHTQQNRLTALQAHISAWVDYPEEDVPALGGEELEKNLAGVEQVLSGLIARYDAGAVLREGVDCAIVGRPNAGKSTLLNLLAGFDRAIVTPVAGTTRDVVEQAVTLGEIRLNLFDTAGMHDTADTIEAEGIRRSWQKLAEAGLILAVFDGGEEITAEDIRLAEACRGKPAIALINKEDVAQKFDETKIQPDFRKMLNVCCREPDARAVIARAVAELLHTETIDPHAAALANRRQLAAAVRAHEAVVSAQTAAKSGYGLDAVSVCVDDALDALFGLTGENAGEAVVNEVFETFCVGK